ncbi:MAG: putative ABC transport system permease protein [Gammaproteobacteria bacterium]|jgi:putative ABC transport system permease protein
MNNVVELIPIPNLAWTFVPVLIVIGILYWWSLDVRTTIYAVIRMLIQLLLIGYALVYIFETDNAWVVVLILAVMLLASSWIAVRPINQKKSSDYLNAFISISISGVCTLWLVTQTVLELQPWFLPHYMIPLAGMIFANSMNSVSLAAERYESEIANGVSPIDARHTALHASLIPTINMLFAVGLVSLPGMMTGQILSGVSPHIAVRYQIMVMCMIFGSAGISSACFLTLTKLNFATKIKDQER